MLRKRMLLGIAGGLLLLCILGYAESNWAIVLWHLLTNGAIALLWLLSAALLGHALLKRLRLMDADASPALLLATSTGLGLGIFSLLILALGCAGWLNRWTALILLAIGLCASAWGRPRVRFQETRISAWHWLLLAAMPLLAMALVAALVPPGVLWGPDDPSGYDVVEYHLQIPREWYELGQMAPLHHNVFSFFPQNVEMHYLLAMHLRGGPWAGMYLAQFMHVGFTVLVLIAVYGAARTIAPAPQACIATLAAALAPWLTMLAPVAYNEGGMLLFATLSLGWTMRYLQSSNRKLRSMVVAGLCGGFAAGCKLTSGPTLLLAIPVALLLVITLSNRRALLHALAACTLFVALGALVLSPWLLRTWLWSGNPVFPEAAEQLGCGDFSQVQVERWQAAHAPRQDQTNIQARLQAVTDQVIKDFRDGYFLLPLGILSIALAARHQTTWFLAIMLVLLTVFWLFFTHLQSRFYVLAIPLAALLIAQVGRRAWPGIAAAMLIAAVPAFTQLQQKFMKLNAVLGLEDPRPILETILPPEVASALRANRPLVLVGDAKAFWYSVPDLRYRTVFDVDTSDDGDIIRAWIGSDPLPKDALILVDPNELARFAKTYKHIPQLAPEYRNRSEPFVLTGQ